MAAYDRRRFLSKSMAGAAIAAPAMVAASSSLASQADISQLGKTPRTRFAVNVEMWWTSCGPTRTRTSTSWLP